MNVKPEIIIAITEDHPMVVQGITQIVSQTLNIKLQAAYGTGKALLEGLQNQPLPDVLLLDVMLPDCTAEDLIPGIIKSYPGIRILIVTSIDNVSRVRKIIKAGSLGYILKSSTPDLLIEAIESVYKGVPFITQELSNQLVDSLLFSKKNMPVKGDMLTRREKEILVLIAAGLQNSEISKQLFISINTIETHRRNLFLKLDVKNAVALINKATALGLI